MQIAGWRWQSKETDWVAVTVGDDRRQNDTDAQSRGRE